MSNGIKCAAIDWENETGNIWKLTWNPIRRCRNEPRASSQNSREATSL